MMYVRFPLSRRNVDDLMAERGIDICHETVNYGDSALNPDPVSRLSQMAQNLASTPNDLTLGFTYNPASQIASTTRSNDSYAWTGHVNVGRAYTTNGLNQYTAAGPASFTYDARGNLTGDGTNTSVATGLHLYVEHCCRGGPMLDGVAGRQSK